MCDSCIDEAYEEEEVEDFGGEGLRVQKGLVDPDGDGVLRDIVSGVREGSWSPQECLEVLMRFESRLPPVRRAIVEGQGTAVLCGLSAVGGFKGLSTFTDQYPNLVRYLNGFLKRSCPKGVWTTVYLSHNARMSPHRDRRNALEFPIVARAVGNFKGGGLWLESEDGTVCRELPDGTKRAGLVHDLRNSSLEFSGNDWHASEDWIGDRWILSALYLGNFGVFYLSTGTGLGIWAFRLRGFKSSGSLVS